MDPSTTAVLALHFQHNVIHPDGVFGPMLAEPAPATPAPDADTPPPVR